MTPAGPQGGQLSGADGELDLEQFERAVRLRLQHYSGRVLAERITVARNSHGGGEGGGGGGGGGGGRAAADDASAQLVVLKAVATAQTRLEAAVAQILQAAPSALKQNLPCLITPLRAWIAQPPLLRACCWPAHTCCALAVVLSAG